MSNAVVHTRDVLVSRTMERSPADGNRNGGVRTYAPLPSGRHALPEEVVAEHQRARLEEAILAAAGEVGYEEVAVKDVLERAGTSRRVFYALYSDKADCFLAAFEGTVTRLGEMCRDAAGSEESWRERLRAALSALLTFVDQEPLIARALVVEVHAAGPAALEARAEAMRSAAAALDELMTAVGTTGANPSSTTIRAEGVLGGIEQSVRLQLRGERKASALELLPSLMHFAVLSYRGPVAAAEELAPAES
jgi:AcrR family transcriptional regulator